MRCRLFGSKKSASRRPYTSGGMPPRCSRVSACRHHFDGPGTRGARVYSEELRRDDEEQREGAGDLDRAEVQGVDLGADLPRQVGVLDLLQARAVDVPNAALPDIS